MILLIGIVKKNAIMMIDFALQAERERGMNSRDAIFTAATMRFRPIMMTTTAALLGALPLCFPLGEGSELRQPLGVSIVGGLIVSQALTLYTTPLVYLYLDRLGLRVRSLWSGARPEAQGPGRPPARSRKKLRPQAPENAGADLERRQRRGNLSLAVRRRQSEFPASREFFCAAVSARSRKLRNVMALPDLQPAGGGLKRARNREFQTTGTGNYQVISQRIRERTGGRKRGRRPGAAGLQNVAGIPFPTRANSRTESATRPYNSTLTVRPSDELRRASSNSRMTRYPSSAVTASGATPRIASRTFA